MTGKHIKGFIDPITLGFVIAITGAALGLHLGGEQEAARDRTVGEIGHLEPSGGPATSVEE